MKIKIKELGPLRLPAVMAAIVAVCAWLLIAYADNRLGTAQRELQAATTALQSARAQYQRSGEEKESILRYGPAYEQLRQEGFVGAERRIAWLEALHNADRRVGLFGVRYQIEAQQRYDGPLSLPSLSSQLRSSQMVLDFGVAHEGDLLRFLETLRSQQVGVFSVRSCSLDPAGRDIAPQPRRPNLRANCDIRWLSIQGPGEEVS